jgi:hypothetical protein
MTERAKVTFVHWRMCSVLVPTGCEYKAQNEIISSKDDNHAGSFFGITRGLQRNVAYLG